MRYLNPVAALFMLCLSLQGSTGAYHNGAVIQRPWKVRQYLSKYRYLAATLKAESGIPMSVTFAVAGLESDWGLSELAKNCNNHFGIKRHDWEGPVYCKSTLEWREHIGYFIQQECFRKYALIAESYKDFLSFLRNRPHFHYRFDMPAWNYPAWAWQFQDGGYATDPQYAMKLIRVIEEYRLYELDE
jgi:flagellum-specific peptidoglycan hydrolase FlgJ